MADGLWRSRKQSRSFHQPRLRREASGELIQIDGSNHRWFKDRSNAITLLVFTTLHHDGKAAGKLFNCYRHLHRSPEAS